MSGLCTGRLAPESDRLRCVTNLDYEEIIAFSEDPEVTLEGVPGELSAPEDFERVEEVADAIFCQSSLETRIKVTWGWPAHVSAPRLALLSDHQRDKVLSHLPPDLAKKIISLLPFDPVSRHR